MAFVHRPGCDEVTPLLADALIMGFIAGVVVRRTPAKRMFAASELFRQSIKKGYMIH
jgi:hypothetical protein